MSVGWQRSNATACSPISTEHHSLVRFGAAHSYLHFDGLEFPIRTVLLFGTLLLGYQAYWSGNKSSGNVSRIRVYGSKLYWTELSCTLQWACMPSCSSSPAGLLREQQQRPSCQQQKPSSFNFLCFSTITHTSTHHIFSFLIFTCWCLSSGLSSFCSWQKIKRNAWQWGISRRLHRGQSTLLPQDTVCCFNKYSISSVLTYTRVCLPAHIDPNTGECCCKWIKRSQRGLWYFSPS